MTAKACIFDAYGTLFDVTAAAREAAAEPEHSAIADSWGALAALWRDKQLAYTWLRAAAGDHTDFWSVTQDALDYALEAHGLDSPALRERLLALYWELSAYGEVPAMLADLKARGTKTAILSNGSKDMLSGAIRSAGLDGVLDAVLSVDDVGVFKPAPQVYAMAETEFAAKAPEMMFISSNGWDAACAARYGYQTVWVNRTGLPTDRLSAQPAHILPDLTGLPALVGR